MKNKEPNYPAILHFESPSAEYIVIATEGPISDHLISGFNFKEAIELNKTGFLPLNESLWTRD